MDEVKVTSMENLEASKGIFSQQDFDFSCNNLKFDGDLINHIRKEDTYRPYSNEADENGSQTFDEKTPHNQASHFHNNERIGFCKEEMFCNPDTKTIIDGDSSREKIIKHGSVYPSICRSRFSSPFAGNL